MDMRSTGNDSHSAASGLTHLARQRHDIEPGKLKVDEKNLALLVGHPGDSTCLIGSMEGRVTFLASGGRVSFFSFRQHRGLVASR